MGSKDAPQKMQSLGAIQKLASLGLFIQNAKWWKNHTHLAFSEPEWVMFLHIPRAHEQGQICIYGFMSKMYFGTKFLRF